MPKQFNKLHSIHLENGRFSPQTDTQASDIDNLLDSFINSDKPNGLAIHFQGGLVSHDSGVDITRRLSATYKRAGAYPVFFVWESGAYETIANNIADIAHEVIFKELVRKVIEFALGRLGDNIGSKEDAVLAIDPLQIEKTIDKWFAKETDELPYADYTLNDVGDRIRAVPPDASYVIKIQANLENDPRFKAAVEAVSQSLLPSGTDELTGGGVRRAAQNTLMTPEAVASILETQGHGQRAMISMAKMAAAIAEVVFKVILRFLIGRDHGLYATVEEEILRTFYIDKIGKTLFWDQMKKDTEDSFSKDIITGKEPGGTIFIKAFAEKFKHGSKPCITLIGHSTGAIYLCNFIKAADDVLPKDVKFDILLISPAASFRLFHDTTIKYANRINTVWLLGMEDELEKANAMTRDIDALKDIARWVYPHSLLYFISGLLEDDIDMPILGMKRFFDQEEIFDGAHFPEVDSLRGFFDESDNGRSWRIKSGASFAIKDVLRSYAAVMLSKDPPVTLVKFSVLSPVPLGSEIRILDGQLNPILNLPFTDGRAECQLSSGLYKVILTRTGHEKLLEVKGVIVHAEL